MLCTSGLMLRTSGLMLGTSGPWLLDAVLAVLMTVIESWTL